MLFESFPAWAPYQCCFNNSLGYKDPTGLKPDKEKGEKGNKVQIYKEGWVSDQEMQAMIYGIIMEAWESSCKFIDMLNKLDYEEGFGYFKAQIREHQEANRFHRRGGSSDVGQMNGGGDRLGSSGGSNGEISYVDSKGSKNSSGGGNIINIEAEIVIEIFYPTNEAFSSPDEAAESFARIFETISIVLNIEMGTKIYRNEDGTYNYARPVAGTENESSPDLAETPRGTITVATAHTHGSYSEEFFNDRFSRADLVNAKGRGMPTYMSCPNGNLWCFDPLTGKQRLISSSMPCDPHDPINNSNSWYHLNNIFDIVKIIIIKQFINIINEK